jgi:bacteriorhodopsin
LLAIVVVKHAFIKQYFIETEKKIINKQIKLTENTQYTFAHIVCILPVKKNCKKIFFISRLVFGSIVVNYYIIFRLTKAHTPIFQYDFKTILFLIYPFALVSAFAFDFFL